MQSGYYSAVGGMVTQFNRLDVVANNLANVNTAGFKQDNLIFGDYLRLYKESRDDLPNQNQTKEAAKFLNRTITRVPQVVDKYTDFGVGNLQKTGNQLDFALSREGLFFVVKTPNGIRLTRDGSFTTNENGELITKQGYKVLGDDYFKSGNGIKFDIQEDTITVDKNGQLWTNLPNSPKLQMSSKLFIAQPENIKMLQKEGDNLYKYDDINQMEPLEESGAVLQGTIEKSNVNAVEMMTELIQTNRLVGMYQKAMESQMNDMNRDVIEKIARKA